MRGRNTREIDNAEVDLTPMLDVTFILLIFFIVTSTFANEKSIGLEPPPPPSEGQNPNTAPVIQIVVDESNLIMVNGRMADIGSVRANIERVRAETPDASVIIQAHPKTKSGVVVLIRDAAYSAGYQDRVNITLSQTE